MKSTVCTKYYIVVVYRYEAFNSIIRKQNINSNRLSSSRDIAYHFAVLEQLHFVCSGNYYDQANSVQYAHSFFPISI